MNERTRNAVDIAMSVMRPLEPAELDDAIEELERQMIALAEGRATPARVVDPPQTVARGEPGWLIYCDCGAPAYRLLRKTNDGDYLDSAGIEYALGTLRVRDGDLIGCLSCKGAFERATLDGLRDRRPINIAGQLDARYRK